MTFGEIRKIALGMEGVEEATSYGTPAFKVNGQMIARLREELGALVVHMKMEDREALLAEDPETYFITDHYLDYPYILVKLARTDPDAIRDLLGGAWRLATLNKKATALGTRRKPRAGDPRSRRR
jgi:hypothetical protein